MKKIGLVGVGYLGKIHLKCIKELPCYEFVGIYDINSEEAGKIAKETGLTLFPSLDALTDAVDVVDIVTPTFAHFDCAVKALDKGKHVFIEKPITNTLQEADTLIALAKEKGVKIQVGHVERFNPAFLAVQEHLKNPAFVETHRLALFNPRGCDVPVVLDLMIHDLDIILHVMQSPLKHISAGGVAIISDTVDIVNARLEFETGSVANLTSSRLSIKNMRKSRFFLPQGYISVDFLEKKSEILHIKDAETDNPFAIRIEPGNGKPDKEISFEMPTVVPNNAIQEELRSFHEAIVNDTPTVVSGKDGREALNLALLIMKEMVQTKAKL